MPSHLSIISEPAVIDTHQHLLYPECFHYPWTASLPALQGGFRLPDYQTATAGCGIEGTLFMEVDVAAEQSADEARYFCEMADDPASGILGLIAACRPENTDFESRIETLAHPKLL